MGKTRVIVLGGGMSGLACAKELLHRGCEVLVVEARSRVGGRLKCGDLELQPQPSSIANNVAADTSDSYVGDETTTSIAPATSQPIDLGGALIHGIDKNPIHSLTLQMGVGLHKISDYCLLLDQNGWPFDPKQDEKLSTLFNECLEETFQRAAKDKQSEASFGHLFGAVCKERGVSSYTDNPLLKWHQANLELPSGADFDDLGYTWNDDEPYGFAGAHVALESSWKAVTERLAEGLDILYHSPVKGIAVVLPDGSIPSTTPPTHSPASAPSNDAEMETVESSSAVASSSSSRENIAPIRSRSRKNPPSLKRASKPTSPARFSRRLRGDDASVRRSNRSTKGVIQMLSIGFDAGLSYDDPTLKSKNRKRKRKIDTSTTVGTTLDEGENEALPELPSSTVQVTLQNGTVLEADAVVCTVPLGILKIPSDQPGHIRFAPPLPASKQEAIHRLGCGVLNKCAMSFPAVFWQDSDFLGLAGEEHSYLVLNATKYTDKPILIFMYGGSFASELESWTDSAIVNDCLSVLKKICGRDVPAPVDYCVTRWGQEQYSKMAFTYIPPGVEGSTQLSAMSEAIYDPVLPQKPLIMFAGEHTTPYHPSTIHGAFLSGIREAYRLDLFLEPQLNDYMVFEANEKLYQHTFTVRRIKSNTNKARKPKDDVSSKLPAVASAAGTNATQSSYRRRRGAGMMTLRKQPKTILESPVSAASAVKKTPPPSIPTSPSKSRRSQRSLGSKKPDEADSPNPQDESAFMEEKRRIQDALEDRILTRAVDSYGRDVGILRSKLLPVYGSTRLRKADQIRSRWHHLLQKRQEPHATWTSWQAPVVASLVSAQTKPAPPETRDATTENKDDSVRRSRRDVKPIVRIDI